MDWKYLVSVNADGDDRKLILMLLSREVFLSTFVGSESETDDLSGKRPVKVIATLADNSRNA
jgi:hypothetical protein